MHANTHTHTLSYPFTELSGTLNFDIIFYIRFDHCNAPFAAINKNWIVFSLGFVFENVTLRYYCQLFADMFTWFHIQFDLTIITTERFMSHYMLLLHLDN